MARYFSPTVVQHPIWESSLQVADTLQQAVSLAAGSSFHHCSSPAKGGGGKQLKVKKPETQIFARCLVLQQCSPIPNRNNPAAASRNCCAVSLALSSRKRPSPDRRHCSLGQTINPYNPYSLTARRLHT